MPAPRPSRAQLVRENRVLRARLAEAERALAMQHHNEQRVQEQNTVAEQQTSSMDVTERMRAEAALQESERKLHALFDLFPVGVSILDAERRIVFVNPALEQILDIEHKILLQGGYRTRRYLRPDGTPMPTEA